MFWLMGRDGCIAVWMAGLMICLLDRRLDANRWTPEGRIARLIDEYMEQCLDGWMA